MASRGGNLPQCWFNLFSWKTRAVRCARCRLGRRPIIPHSRHLVKG